MAAATEAKEPVTLATLRTLIALHYKAHKATHKHYAAGRHSGPAWTTYLNLGAALVHFIHDQCPSYGQKDFTAHAEVYRSVFLNHLFGRQSLPEREGDTTGITTGERARVIYTWLFPPSPF